MRDGCIDGGRKGRGRVVGREGECITREEMSYGRRVKRRNKGGTDAE